jgi:hypothetical protein
MAFSPHANCTYQPVRSNRYLYFQIACTLIVLFSSQYACIELWYTEEYCLLGCETV